eukprot:TRINITY_DN8539_c0_g2_i2.p1 TRINITY_DN8539_c0_g2~~TRINITY_DN8539_c0_g2_i2.p1  ORF type:complete len:334 (+),score=54.44 TRINITY_DN8539_c0_g2_i2:112-1113(+)
MSSKVQAEVTTIQEKDIVEIQTTAEPKEPKEGIGVFHLIMMAYFWTVGGPFGIESSVLAGGPLLTTVLVCVLIVFWCLPQGLMAAELALLTKANGGGILWVQRAFGDFIGFVSAYSTMVSYVINGSIYLVLSVSYIGSAVDLVEWQCWLIKIALVLVTTFINIKGLHIISILSLVVLVLSFIPFITEFIMMFLLDRQLYWEAFGFVPEEIIWGTLISNTIWNVDSFDLIGTLAGDVTGGQPTYTLGLFGTFPLVLVTFVFPVLVGIALEKDITKWDNNAFTDIAYTVASSLGLSMVIAAILSNFASINANLLSTSRQMWAMAKGKESFTLKRF